jgi:hypothetical protein
MNNGKLPSNRTRQVQTPHRFTDLKDPSVPARITESFQKLAKEISTDRVVQELPTPSNFTAQSGLGHVRLCWSDVDDSLRKHRDCARIWRAKASDDANTDFNQNMARVLIVEGVKSTTWYDFLPNTDPYLYWVAVVNMDGVQSNPAGGLVAAAS